MKKGINVWSFPGGMNLTERMELAKKAGFEGIEPALNETGELSLESTEKEILEIRKRAEDIGIPLTSLATGLYWNYSLTSEQKDVREKAKDIVRKQLEAAALLGVDTILVVPGVVGVDFMAGGEVVEYDRAYEYALEALQELAKDAQEAGVSIGVENVWNKFLLSPLEMRDFIDRVGSEYVGAYFDVGNVISTGYPEHWIKILGKRIKKVHFKDYRRAVGTITGFVDLLAGDVDYPKVIEELEAIGYKDYVIAEMGVYARYPEQIVWNTSRAMDVILGRCEA